MVATRRPTTTPTTSLVWSLSSDWSARENRHISVRNSSLTAYEYREANKPWCAINASMNGHIRSVYGYDSLSSMLMTHINSDSFHQSMGWWTVLTFCQDAGSSTPLSPSNLCFINDDTLSKDWIFRWRVQGDMKSKYEIKSLLSVSNIWFPQKTWLPPAPSSHPFLQARRPQQLTLFIHSHLLIYWNEI